MNKKIIKFGVTDIEKQISPTQKPYFDNKKIDINKMVVSNKFFLIKKVLNVLLVTKVVKKLEICLYCFPKNKRF